MQKGALQKKVRDQFGETMAVATQFALELPAGLQALCTKIMENTDDAKAKAK